MDYSDHGFNFRLGKAERRKTDHSPIGPDLFGDFFSFRINDQVVVRSVGLTYQTFLPAEDVAVGRSSVDWSNYQPFACAYLLRDFLSGHNALGWRDPSGRNDF